MPVAVDYEITLREAEKALRGAAVRRRRPQHLAASTTARSATARSAACCSAAPSAELLAKHEPDRTPDTDPED